MKIEAIRKIINAELETLPHKFSDPITAIGKLPEIEEKLGIRLRELFKLQSRLDSFKKKISPLEFRALLCCYFREFVGDEGFDYLALDKEINSHRRALNRHVGEGWIYAIATMINVLKEIDKKEVQKRTDEKPRGLLRVAD